MHQIHAEVRGETAGAFLRFEEFRERVPGRHRLHVELGTRQRVPQGGVYLPAQGATRHERVHRGAVVAQNLAVAENERPRRAGPGVGAGVRRARGIFIFRGIPGPPPLRVVQRPAPLAAQDLVRRDRLDEHVRASVRLARWPGVRVESARGSAERRFDLRGRGARCHAKHVVRARRLSGLGARAEPAPVRERARRAPRSDLRTAEATAGGADAPPDAHQHLMAPNSSAQNEKTN